jgi:CRP/FNR family cyclic AMP-dependent transcriptional regulator
MAGMRSRSKRARTGGRDIIQMLPTEEASDDLLSRHPFFTGLKSEYLALIAGCGQNVHFDAGAYLLREGQAADRFFAIRGGSVAVETYVPSRGAVTLQTIGEGEILGWSWLFPALRVPVRCPRAEDVRATAFDGACLRGKCDANPALGYDLMKRVARLVSSRLEATRRQLLDVYGPGLTTR